MKIKQKKNNKVKIIAEIGVNHNGSLRRAKKLIIEAKKLGVDAVKFQFFQTSALLAKNTKALKYQQENTKVKSQNELLKKLELTILQMKNLQLFCKKNSIEFMCTFFDTYSLKYIPYLELKSLKIPSGELTNVPYLEKIAKFNLPTYISSGISNLAEIKKTVLFLNKKGLRKKNIIIFHCTSLYPTPDKEVSLKNITHISERLNCQIGFSDHTVDSLASIAAVSLGCKYLERHFTLNKNDIGPDHKSSSDKKELKIYVSNIRRLEEQLYSRKKNLSKNLLINKNQIEKKIVALKKIKVGEKFSNLNITTKRSSKGVSAIHWYKYINKKSKKYYFPDDPI